MVGTHIVSELSKTTLIQQMVGRDVDVLNIQRRQARTDIIMSVSGLSVQEHPS